MHVYILVAIIVHICKNHAHQKKKKKGMINPLKLSSGQASNALCVTDELKYHTGSKKGEKFLQVKISGGTV